MSGCKTNYGDKYTLGSLEIYFTKEISHDMVVDLGNYFRDNDLITDQKQSVQLTSTDMSSDNPGYVLNMILNQEYKKLPEEQELNLQLLEADLEKEVFGSANLNIVVCNENFNPIEE